MPLHKKNPEVGTKVTVFSDTVIVEQEDAKTFAENEEVSKTFLTLIETSFADQDVDYSDGLG